MILNFFSECAPLDVGCKLYSDPEMTILVPDSFYSDGTNCYTLDNGIVTAKDLCVTPCDLAIVSITSTDPTTLGGTDGTITVAFTGSSGPFTYSIASAVAGSEPLIIGGPAVSPFTITGLSSNTPYLVSVFDINNCTVSAIVTLGQTATLFDADWIQITYEFSDGRDLDTRTRIALPDIGQNTQPEYMGWGLLGAFDPVNGTLTANNGGAANPLNYIMLFGGDNVGVGFESVLINVARFKQLYPVETEFTIDIRGFWHATGVVGVLPVNAGVTLWKGGTPVHDGCGTGVKFCWTNPGAQFTKTIDSVPTKVSLQIGNATTSGVRIATLRYDLFTFVSVLNNADTTTPSV